MIHNVYLNYIGEGLRMKNYVLIILIVVLFFPIYSIAEDFLGVPVIHEGRTIKKTGDRLELKVNLSHDEVVTFYRDTLEGLKDIKFREWRDATYIEDDGSRPWHSITISKRTGKETTITIVKDNWTWIIGTLVLRYIGVFVVLTFLFLGMYISGKIISGLVKRTEARNAAG